MIYFPSSLGQLRDAVADLIEAVGEDAPVGMKIDDYFNDNVQLEWVYIDAQNDVVGTEAEDYKPAAGERAAIRVN
jgi:hypothetical protein